MSQDSRLALSSVNVSEAVYLSSGCLVSKNNVERAGSCQLVEDYLPLPEPPTSEFPALCFKALSAVVVSVRVLKN